MKTLKTHFITLIFSLIFFDVNAQLVPQKLEAAFNNTLDSMQKVLKCKGLSASIQLSNTGVWAAGKGKSSEVPIVSMNSSHAFLIGSVVKTITSACVLQLVDEQKIGLDDPIYKYVDTFKYINPNITVRQLLRHQSGIFDVLQHPQNQTIMLQTKDSIWAYKDVITKFIKPAVFDAGTSWDYSNTNYFLLAMIIEKVTGEPYYVQYKKRFFSPLGLNSFTIPAYEKLPTNVAHVWIDLNGDGILDDAHNFYTSWKSLNALAGSAGGYYALPSDVAKWIRTYMRGDLLSPSTFAKAKETVFAPSANNSNYGLGLMERTIGGLKAYGHGGDLSYAASSWYFPSKDISITVHTNDSKTNSWALLPTVAQLLKTYLKNEALVSANEEIVLKDIDAKIFPNPLNETSTFSIQLPNASNDLKLICYNAFGTQEAVIEHNNISEGKQNIKLNQLQDLAQGVHFINVFINGKMSSTVRFLKV